MKAFFTKVWAWMKANPKKVVAAILVVVVMVGALGVGCKVGYGCGKAAQSEAQE